MTYLLVPEQHVRDRRKNPSACVACTQQKRALGETTGNSRSHRKKTRSGCLQCGVALCNSDDCWYLFHSQSI
ncbi:hypothetical protein BDP81DRAFT_139960 [Colletotrichum phormii]|uniref:PiggyBac transposable element-derived protein 4 C-terminal zinc-ribbon domain-containing protein n=1 Tax=Colletotrichum phormii TaxID=359342 RepID=A0AAJ0E918_9PEZI|nr:uncharacterized protein BDP81DRAFT_139960 [Colletotrichum phormii]KAK1623161.1 hypothetical protein BDP81DRAFT_139960 [Colletotrichum phormii]